MVRYMGQLYRISNIFSVFALINCCVAQTNSSYDNLVALIDDPTTVNGLEGMVLSF